MTNAKASADVQFAKLYSANWASAVDIDKNAADAFGAPFARSGYLRTLLGGHGLITPFPAVWPTNVSFEQILDEAGAEQPMPRAGPTGFAVNVGAGDGK